jgi:outer membrane protein TolC
MLHAQTPPEAVPANSRAVELPLSGRAASPGSVATVQTPLPGGGAQSVNTINSTVQVQGAYQGSVLSAPAPGGPISLSFDEAVRRGLEYNLGTVGYQQIVRQAMAQSSMARSSLLPNLSGGAMVVEQQTDLAALGFGSIPTAPGSAGFPTVIGPFHYVDLRAGLTQSIIDLTRMKNYRASQENVRAAQFSAADARDLVVLAVTGAYLQVDASMARVASAQAQVATSQATYRQAVDRHESGLTARIDVTRSQVELQINEQRLTSVENDLAKQKIQLGRLIGLPPGQAFTVSDQLPYSPLNNITLDQALLRATSYRSDLKAAEAQVHAAELAKQAAISERLPNVSISSDYGAIGTSPTSAHGTFNVTGAIRFPIFDGGRIRADVEQADAALNQRRAEYSDLKGRVDAEVRSAFLDLTSAANQVKVAQSNRELAADTLQQARDRFAAGVADTVEVVQAQEAVAVAEQDYIAALYAHNLAKASLARAMGQADQSIKQFLGNP